MDARVEPAAERKLSREHWIAVAASFGALAGLVLMRLVLTPDPHGFGTHEQLGLPPCRSMEWFGIPCPGCGVTTSVTWFAHGDLWRSFRTQPFGFLLAFGAAVAPVIALVLTWRGHDLGEFARARSTRRTWLFVLAAAALAWIYKIAVTFAG